MATYGHTFTSGDTLTPTKLNAARTATDIVNADIAAAAAIALSKLATGALPAAITVASDNLVDGTIVNADINASAAIDGTKIASDSITNAQIKSDAAIAGTKIAPDFGSQNVVTTGSVLLRHTALVGTYPIEVHDADSLASYRWNSSSSAGAWLRFHRSRSGTKGTNTVVQSGDAIAQIAFQGDDGTSFIEAARITAAVDGTPGANDMPGRLVFSTTADGGSSPTERMRINNDGDVLVGQSSTIVPGQSNTTTGHCLVADGRIYSSCNGAATATVNRNTSNGPLFSLRRQGSVVGSIDVTTTATSFVTSSDYRLKQNVELMTGGLAKLAQLKPSTFEFKAEPNVKVDGFIAHEVQAVVPQAVTGEKDGEEMQGLDHSKLVPVLVAALQELSAKVAALEAAR